VLQCPLLFQKLIDMKILLFCSKGIGSNIVYSYLLDQHELVCVVVDSPQSKLKLVKRRIKKLGILNVISQLIFMLLMEPLLRLESKKRRKSILDQHNIKDLENFANVHYPNTINSLDVIEKVNEYNPELILVHGTRIISKKILNKINLPIINIHSGITPHYRGVHGGYWALANQDLGHCGVTVHRVDKGIDTGSILIQGNIKPTSEDNFCTYPLLQIIKGKEILEEFLKSQNFTDEIIKSGDSKLYYHPGIFQYLGKRLKFGIK
jgi:hypothetical protein